MAQQLFWVFISLIMLTLAEEREQSELLVDSAKYEAAMELLKCFRCDLGFWDACYTTETKCDRGERCYTGRGKAADVLDVKTLGCAKAEECGVETTVAVLPNNTIFVMTKHCCDTPFCNSARQHLFTLLHVALALLLTLYVTGAFI